MAIDVDMSVEEVPQCATESYSFSDDFWMAIFTHLDAASLCVISQTCYGLYLLAEDKLLWYVSLCAGYTHGYLTFTRKVESSPKR